MICNVSLLDPIDPIPLPPDPGSLAAGDTYSDPTFSTTSMWITDETDSNDNKVAYSYWPSFNEDCSRLLVSTGSIPSSSSDYGPTLFEFNAETFVLDHTSKTALSTALGGKTIQWEGATWSGTYGSPQEHPLLTVGVGVSILPNPVLQGRAIL